MPRQKETDKLDTMLKRRAEIDAQIKLLEARKKDTERKHDTRRKVIAGALALEHFEANPDSEFAAVMLRLLNRYVSRPSDRALFPVLSGVAPEPEQQAAE